MLQNIKEYKMRICFPKERYLASILLRLHKLNNPDIEQVFLNYQVSFEDKTIYIKPRLLNHRLLKHQLLKLFWSWE